MRKPPKIVRFSDTTECKIKFGDLNGDHGEKVRQNGYCYIL